MFEIEMLPGREGDCLWIRYGDTAEPRHILIDGGRQATYRDVKARFMALPEEQREFELFVITHIDRDHIEGALSLLKDSDLKLTFKDIWFNAYHHLAIEGLEAFGAVQGEILTAALQRRAGGWNAAFEGGPVKIPENSELPMVTLEGGLVITLLSPDTNKLASLAPQWDAECARAGLQPGSSVQPTEVDELESFGGIDVENLAAKPFRPDRTLSNGSSIALLMEYKGIRILLAADAHVDRLAMSLDKLLGDESRVRLDAFKLSHHGSSGNTSKELLEMVDCSRYLISTNGAYFSHPNAEAVARVIKFGGDNVSLHFNYACGPSDPWRNEALQAEYGYTAVAPTGANGLVVCLEK